MEAPRLHVKDAAGFSGVWREVHFEEWTSPGSSAQMRIRLEKRRAFLEELPAHRKVITISIVRDDAIKPLDKDQRSTVDEGVAQVAPRAKCGAVVIDSSGFKAVIIRSIIAALTLVQGSKYPTKTFDNLDAMFAWIAPMLESTATAEELSAAYRELVEVAARS